MKALLGVVLLAATVPALAELPAGYRSVDSLDWMVSDLDAVAAEWSRLGFSVNQLGEGRLTVRTPGREPEAFPVRVALGNLAGYRVVWMQADSGGRLRKLLESNTDGVLSVNHRLASADEHQQEVARMAGNGVPVVRELELSVAGAARRVDYLGTRPQGKVTLGLVAQDRLPYPEPASTKPRFRPSQYAFVVRQLEPVSDYWERLGFPAFNITHGPLTDLEFRGEPGRFDQRLGWQRHGEIVYEWIEPLQGPTVYEEALEARGEGFHHLAFDVEDMDEAIRFFGDHRLECSQSGGWGEAGKPGSGRFAYIDTEGLGGITLELLWNYRQ